MIVTRVDLQPCVMRKEDPNWRFALGANPVTEGAVVTVTAQDGAQGFGYGSATPHMGATRETLMAARIAMAVASGVFAATAQGTAVLLSTPSTRKMRRHGVGATGEDTTG